MENTSDSSSDSDWLFAADSSDDNMEIENYLSRGKLLFFSRALSSVLVMIGRKLNERKILWKQSCLYVTS